MSTKALVSRRAALAATAGISLSAQLDLATAGPNGSAAQLVKLAEMKNSAFMRGDMESWARLTRIASDFTLMQPFGGTTSRGFDKSPTRLAELARFFRNGVATLEDIHTYGIEGIIVLVMIERQTAGGWPSKPRLVATRNRSLSPGRGGMGIGASSRRSTRSSHPDRSSCRPCPWLREIDSPTCTRSTGGCPGLDLPPMMCRAHPGPRQRCAVLTDGISFTCEREDWCCSRWGLQVSSLPTASSTTPLKERRPIQQEFRMSHKFWIAWSTFRPSRKPRAALSENGACYACTFSLQQQRAHRSAPQSGARQSLVWSSSWLILSHRF
jgi:hypothetical protein